MERTETKAIRLPRPGGVEAAGVVVTVLVAAAAAVLGGRGVAAGTVAGGLLGVANFTAIRMVVGLVTGGGTSKGFALFVVGVKMAALLALVAGLFLFVRINVYGFLLGVTGVVLVIVGYSLRGK